MEGRGGTGESRRGEPPLQEGGEGGECRGGRMKMRLLASQNGPKRSLYGRPSG